MKIQFPHCPSADVSLELLLAGWQVWVERFGPDAGDPLRCKPSSASMPIAAQAGVLAARIAEGKRYSFDVLCRMLVPCRDTMQATPTLRASVSAWFEVFGATNPATGRDRDEIRLTAQGVALLASLGATDIAAAEAIVLADVEDGQQETLLDTAFDESVRAAAPAPGVVPLASSHSRALLVRDLVDWIHADPFEARYRGRALSPVIHGWADRLQSYFWPTPTVRVAATAALMAPLLADAAHLMAAGGAGPWSTADDILAVQWAHRVFRWGGVPQSNGTPARVRAVFDSVRAGHLLANAPMNSGWTKIAALASDSLPPAAQQVIWDSRVAHALIGRFDAMLHAAGHRGAPPASLQDIGRVPGRGGTRTDATYHLDWPYGYGRWPAQFAGSALVRDIRDELNRRGFACGSANIGTAWTLREVEMVLFMDGY